MFSGVISGVVVALSAVAFVLPHTAGAYWPFSPAHAGGTPTPILHDASLDLLVAPTNSSISSSYYVDANVTTSDGSALIPGSDLGAVLGDAPSETLSIPTNNSISVYTVKPGDSLSEIAQSHGVSVNTILWANDIKSASSIKTGDKLVILPTTGIEYKVRSGDTLQSIAQKYSGDAQDIAQFNGIADNSALAVGDIIIIPGGEMPATPAPKKTTTSTKTTPSSSSTAKKTVSPTRNVAPGSSGFVNPLPGALLTQGIHGQNAVDLGAPAGTSILAAAGGTVILAHTGGYNGGYGNDVIIDHGSYQTLYAHMTQIFVSTGDVVSAGKVLGTVGTTGKATGPHLHFEVRGRANPFGGCEEMSVCSI